MRLTQGTFSFLPDLTDAQITLADRILRCSDGWAVGVEHTEDPHPRNTYWEMYGNPMFDLKDAAGIMREVDECRRAFPNRYIKRQRVRFDSRRRSRCDCRSSSRRPQEEPGFELLREEGPGRDGAYAMRSYASATAGGHRY